MTVSFRPGVGLSFRPVVDTGFLFDISAIVGYDDHASSSEPMTINDTSINRITSDYSDPYYDIQIRGDDSGVLLSALDATGSLNNNRRLSRVTNGTCRVKASSFVKSAIVTCDMTRINGNVYDELVNYVSGSLARHIVDSMTAMIGSKTASAKPIFSVQDHVTPTYPRNAACWTASLDLTAISPWNSRGSNYRAGTAITPRHTIQAAHYPLAVSDTIRFVAMDNTVVTRTISAVQSNPTTDIQVALLDSDLPASITPMQFAPSNLYDYLPSLESFPVPVLATDYEEKAFVKETCPTCWVNTSTAGFFRTSLTDPFSRLVEAIIPGDSGNPVCLVVGGVPVLISHWMGVDTGRLYHKLLTEIAAALTTLGGGYSLSTIDLSSFTNYS